MQYPQKFMYKEENQLHLLHRHGSAAQIISHEGNDEPEERIYAINKRVSVELADAETKCEIIERLDRINNFNCVYDFFGSYPNTSGLEINIYPARSRNESDNEKIHRIMQIENKRGSLLKMRDVVKRSKRPNSYMLDAKNIANLLLFNQFPGFSITKNKNPYNEQCLQEPLPGISILTDRAFSFLLIVTDNFLKTILKHIINVTKNSSDKIIITPNILLEILMTYEALDF